MSQKTAFSSISEYLSFEKIKFPYYYNEIKTQAASVDKILLHKRLCVTIPIHSSEKNIEKALLFYTQQTLSPPFFEICLFLNRRSNDPSFVHLRTAIRKFKQTYSYISVTTIEKTFEKKITMGYIRKYLSDIILLRSNNPSLVHVIQDIDIEYMENRYLKELDMLFQREQFILAHRMSDVPHWIKQYPFFTKLLRFYRAIDFAYNNLQHKSLYRRLGQNYSFTSQLYISVGGFDPRCQIGEDLTFSYQAHKKYSDNIYRATTSRLEYSLRRFFLAYIENKLFIRAWDTFADNTIRSLDSKVLFKKVEEKEQSIRHTYFETEAEKTFNYLIRYRLLPHLDPKYSIKDNIHRSTFANEAITLSKNIFQTALSRLGMTYKLQNNYYPFSVVLTPY